MNSQQQIARCRQPHADYLARAKAADKKMQNGEHQHYCTHCKRWKWQDEQCEVFAVDVHEEAAVLYASVMGY